MPRAGLINTKLLRYRRHGCCASHSRIRDARARYVTSINMKSYMGHIQTRVKLSGVTRRFVAKRYAVLKKGTLWRHASVFVLLTDLQRTEKRGRMEELVNTDETDVLEHVIV